MRVRVGAALALSFSLLSTGCATYHRTQPLATYDLSQGYRFERLDRSIHWRARIAEKL